MTNFFGQSGELKLGPSPLGALQCIAELQELSFGQSGENTAGGKYGYHKLGSDLLSKINPAVKDKGCVLLFSVTESGVTSGMEMVQGRNDPAPRPKLMTYAWCLVTTRIQSVTDADDWVSVTSYGFKVDMTSDKSVGAMTVARRYGLMALCSLAPDDVEDVDGPGNISTFFDPKPSTPQVQTPAATPGNNFFNQQQTPPQPGGLTLNLSNILG